MHRVTFYDYKSRCLMRIWEYPTTRLINCRNSHSTVKITHIHKTSSTHLLQCTCKIEIKTCLAQQIEQCCNILNQINIHLHQHIVSYGAATENRWWGSSFWASWQAVIHDDRTNWRLALSAKAFKSRRTINNKITNNRRKKNNLTEMQWLFARIMHNGSSNYC